MASEDGVLVFSNCVRDLPPDIARAASFVVVTKTSFEHEREQENKGVAGCEGGSCVISRGAP